MEEQMVEGEGEEEERVIYERSAVLEISREEVPELVKVLKTVPEWVLMLDEGII
jgi:hypothetical protein